MTKKDAKEASMRTRSRQASFTEDPGEPQQVPQQPQSSLQQQQSQSQVPQQPQSSLQQQQSQSQSQQQAPQLMMDIELTNQGQRGKRSASQSPDSKKANTKLKKGTEPGIINLPGGFQSTSSATISRIPPSSQPLPTFKSPNTSIDSYKEIGEWLGDLQQQVETMKQAQNSEAIQQQLCQLSKTIKLGEPFAKELDLVKQRNIMVYNHINAAANIIKTSVDVSSAVPTTNTKRLNGSYATVVAPASLKSLTSLPSLPLLPPSPPTPSHILKVYPKTTVEGSTSTSQVTKQLLFDDVNIGKLNIGIRGVRTLPNKGVSIMCRNAEDLDKLSNAIQTTPNLITKTSAKRYPSFSFFVNGDKHQKETILSSLYKKNPSISSGSIKITYIRKTTNNNTVIFLEVSPLGYKELSLLQFELFYDWAVVKLRERLSVTQCGHCLKFGHPEKYCNKKQQKLPKRCSVCAGVHPETAQQCSAQTCCSNCAEYNKILETRRATKIDTSHRADDHSCPSYDRAHKIAKQQVDYYS